MPIPFETFIPYAIIVTMFGVSGAGLSALRYHANGKKRPRHGLDQWDRQSTMILRDRTSTARHLFSTCNSWWQCADASAAVMDRDRRLTGNLRGQSDTPIAPPGYELNNPWRVEKRIC